METEVLAPEVVEANTLPNHEAKVAMVVPAQQWLWHWQKVLIIARKQSLAREESQKSDREAAGYNRFVNSGKDSGGGASLLQRRHVLDNTHVYGQKTLGLYL